MKKWLRRLVGLTVGLLFGLLLGYGYFRAQVIQQYADAIERAETYRPPGSVVLLDRRGEPFDMFWREKRVWVPLDSLPESVWGAIVTAEDRRFFSHSGVDLWGIGRAVRANLSGGRVSQGASSLTQQLVKNLIVGKEKTFDRKAREAVVAWELERRLTKRQLLEMYINYVYLGSGNHGIESAAQNYFGKPAAEMTAAEAALVASLIPAPSRFDPRLVPDAALARRDRVLEAMVDTGYLDAATRDQALKEPITLAADGVQGNRSGAAYATHVRRLLLDTLEEDAPFELAMRVHTPLDAEIQRVAEQAVKAASTRVMDRQGIWAIVEHLRAGAPRDAFLDVTAADPAPGDCFHALLTATKPMVLTTKNHSWTLAKGEFSRKVRNRYRRQGSGQPFWGTARVGDKVRVCRSGDAEVVLDGRDWVQGAAVVIDHNAGEVIAMVGGNDPVLEGFVRATQALRQPGSTFKPFVYATAIEEGRSQLSIMTDEEVTLTASDGQEWTPGNSGREEYRGDVPLRTALAASLNSISVQLVDDVGSDKVADLARRAGVRTPLNEVLSLALGSSEVTVLDQATGFATLANGGVYREPRFIRRVEDREGDLLGVAGQLVKHPDGSVLGELPGRVRQALSPGVAYETADMMRGVMEGGTGRRGAKKGYVRAGKTGTTNQSTDTWFVGFSPRYTVAVWVGTDDNGSLGGGESGAHTALPAWKAIMDALPADPTDAMPIPPEAMRVRWGGRWVGVNRETVPRNVFGVRRIGNRPLPSFPKRRVMGDDGESYVEAL
jgi:penicillin-binding protein 1A